MRQQVEALRPPVEASARVDAALPSLRAGLSALDAALGDPASLKAESARQGIATALDEIKLDAEAAGMTDLSQKAEDLSGRVQYLTDVLAQVREAASRFTPESGRGPEERLRTIGDSFEAQLTALPPYASDVTQIGLRLVGLERRLSTEPGPSFKQDYDALRQRFGQALEDAGLPTEIREPLQRVSLIHVQAMSTLLDARTGLMTQQTNARTSITPIIEEIADFRDALDQPGTEARAALAKVEEQRLLVSGGLAAGLAFLYVLIAFLLRRSVTKPLGDLGEAVGHLSVGGGDEPLPGRQRNDEIGRIARGMEDLRFSASEQLDAADRKFEAAKAYLSAVLESTPNPVITVSEEGSVVSFNPAAELMFQRRGADVIGRSVAILMPKEDRGEEETALSWFRESDSREVTNPVRRVRGLRADGGIFPAELTLSELHRPVGGVLFLLFLHDLSDEVRSIEEARASKMSADQAGRAHGEFLNVLGTELALPVAAMNDAFDQDRPDLAKVEHCLTVLNAITNDVRGFADLEAGLADLDFQPVNVQEVCEGAVNANLEMANDFGLRLALAIRPGTPQSILGDGELLQAILRNMTECMLNFVGLDPSMHAANPGTITIGVRTIRRAGGGAGLRFEIGSEPAPMNKRLMARGNQRIGRSKAAQIRMEVGSERGRTGMLLVISKRLAALMRGDIDMDSWPGRGTVLWFEMDV